MPFLFVIPGILVDLAFRYMPARQRSWWFLALIAGAVHVTKPLLRAAAVSGLGLSYGFLKDGLWYVVLLHFFFGAVGGLISYLYVLGSSKPQSQPNR